MPPLGIFGQPPARRQEPPPELSPPPILRGDVCGAARAGLDVPRVMFACWLYDHAKINEGEQP